MLSEKPWKAETVLLLVSALFLSLFLGMSGQMFLHQALPGLREPVKEFFSFAINIFAFHGVALILMTFFLRAHQVSWAGFLGLEQRHLPKTVACAAAAGVVFVPLALALTYGSSALMELLGRKAEPQFVVQVLQVTPSVPKRIFIVVAAVLLAPVAEEGLFRGILYPALKQQGYPRVALWGTSLLFASFHANLMAFVPLTVFALVLVALYEKSDTLVAPIGAHAAFNAVNASLLMLQPDLTRWFNHPG